MISDKTYRQLINTCDFRRQKESDECESLYSYAMDQEFGNIDQYNIYAPPCNNSDGSATTHRTMRLPHRPRHPVYYMTQVNDNDISFLKVLTIILR
jgi:serine carboxypeptidase-like clade 2